MGLMNIDTEWLFVVPDTDYMDAAVANQLTEMRDGQNVAMVYNSSLTNSNECQVKLSFLRQLI